MPRQMWFSCPHNLIAGRKPEHPAGLPSQLDAQSKLIVAVAGKQGPVLIRPPEPLTLLLAVGTIPLTTLAAIFITLLQGS